jgi:tetratricopeptide (TPR) repeat protein
MKTHYDVLGVSPEADAETIKAAYRRALKEHHPDLHDGNDVAEARSKAIIDAYTFLKDADRRSIYDERLKSGRQQRRRLFLITLLASTGLATLVSLGLIYLALAPENTAHPDVAVAASNPEAMDEPASSPPEQSPQAAATGEPSAPEAEVHKPPRPADTAATPENVPPAQPATPTGPDEPTQSTKIAALRIEDAPLPAADPAPSPASAEDAPSEDPAGAQRAAAWLEIEKSGDALRAWDFLHAYPGTTEAGLAMIWLEEMIDTSQDSDRLQALRARATGPIAQRIAARMAILERGPATQSTPAQDAASPQAAPAAGAVAGAPSGASEAQPVQPPAPGETEAAIASLDEAIRRDPTSADNRLRRGLAWIAKRMPERAVLDFSAAIGLDGSNVAAYHQRGLVWKQLGDEDSALADLDQAIRLSLYDAKIYVDRGTIWYQRGRYDLAIADFDRAIAFAPGLASAHYHRGLALERNGDAEGAKASFAEAVRLDRNLAGSPGTESAADR